MLLTVRNNGAILSQGNDFVDGDKQEQDIHYEETTISTDIHGRGGYSLKN